MPISATRNSNPERIAKKALVDRKRMMLLRRLEPFIEQSERGEAVHRPARNPHDEAGEPLVVDRIEADPGHAHRRIIGIPRARRKAPQRPESTTPHPSSQ